MEWPTGAICGAISELALILLVGVTTHLALVQIRKSSAAAGDDVVDD
jgi:hypothetical protein